MLHKLSLVSVVLLVSGSLAMLPTRTLAQTATVDGSETTSNLVETPERRAAESPDASQLAIAPENESQPVAATAEPPTKRRSTMPCRIFFTPAMDQ